MQIGYNNDVQYRGKTFHIQTEDRGEPAASIETQIFHAGAILDTSIIQYQRVLDETEDVDERIAKVRSLMQGNHKKLYKKLFAGEYDHFVGLERKGAPEEVPEADDFVPSQEAVPAAALEIERGNLDAIAMQEPEGESVDLAELQAQLARDAEAAEGAASGEDSAPTMMMSLDEIPSPVQLHPGGVAGANGRAANGSANGLAPLVNFPQTGATAWRGCEASDDDLDIIKFVEKFAAG